MIPTFCLLKPVFVFSLGISQFVFSLLYRNTILKTWAVKTNSIPANPKHWIISFKHARVHKTRASPVKLTCFALFLQRTRILRLFFSKCFIFTWLRFTKSNYLKCFCWFKFSMFERNVNGSLTPDKFHFRWYEPFSNYITLEDSNFWNSAVRSHKSYW